MLAAVLRIITMRKTQRSNHVRGKKREVYFHRPASRQLSIKELYLPLVKVADTTF